jgi:hypothetical protein
MTATDVMVVGSTISLPTVVGPMTVKDLTTEVTSDTNTVVDGSCDSTSEELYTAVELYVAVTVYDVGTVLGLRVKLSVLVRSMVRMVDRVMLNVVVCSGMVSVLVTFMLDFAVVVNLLVKTDVIRDVVLSVAVGSTTMLIFPFCLLSLDPDVVPEDEVDDI